MISRLVKLWRHLLQRNRFARRSVNMLQRCRSYLFHLASSIHLAIVGVVCSLITGCSFESLTPSARNSSSADAIESSSSESSLLGGHSAPRGSRQIQFESFDIKYRGSTHILADEKVVHQRQTHE